jgi:hypothetical protein
MTRHHEGEGPETRALPQSAAFFLVTPQGEPWRVFDVYDVEAIGEIAVSDDDQVCARAFIQDDRTLIHRFAAGESRAVSASALLEQLRTSEQINPG